MAIVTGTVGGQQARFSTASQDVAGVAASVFGRSDALALTGSAVLANSYFTALNTQPATITGGAAVTVGVLAGGNAQFRMGAAQAAEIVASDNSASTIVNDNANGGLIAFTGAGGNALSGLGVINAFQTGVGGLDAVSFAGNGLAAQTNLLTSLGQDTVNIFGNASPAANTAQVNLVTAVGNGSDNINLRSGAGLTFVNQSTATSTVTATAGSTVNIGGPGSTVVLDSNNGSATYGNGAVTFNISTASGNVTLVGSVSGSDTYNFDKLTAGASTGNFVIGNFNSSSFLHLAGYDPGAYSAQVVNGSTVLTLSDNAQIVFAGVGSASQVLSRIT